VLYLRDFFLSNVVEMNSGDCADRLSEMPADAVSGIVSDKIIFVPEPCDDRSGSPLLLVIEIRQCNRTEMAFVVEQANDEIVSDHMSREIDSGSARPLA
jgi:hypothetical protein